MGPELVLPRAPAAFAQAIGEDFAPVIAERCAVWSLNNTVRGGTGTGTGGVCAVKVCACVRPT